MSAHFWDADAYLAFADERGRPFDELVRRVGAEEPSFVVDVGCGPGNLTSALPDRWPGATVLGVDSSPEMIRAAKELPARSRLSFEQADLRAWRTSGPVDVIVANAVLQWIPDHLALLERLVGQLSHGGWLALQVPGNFEQPSHRLLHELAADPRFAPFTGGVATPRAHDPQVYLEVLTGLGCTVDAWETTYLQVLSGPDPVFRWISGTGARPVLQSLPDPQRAEFEQEYARLLAEAYPPQHQGTVLPFRRVFAVAQRRT